MSTKQNWLTTFSSGREAEFVRLLVLTIIQGFLWNMMVPTLPLFAQSLGASEMHLGVVSTMPAIITIIASVPGSALGLKHGKRAMFLASHVLGVGCGLAFLLTSRLGLIPIPQLAFGLSNTLFWPTQGAYLSDMIPQSMRTRVMGYTMAITGIGMVAGPIVAGLLIDNVGFYGVFWAIMLVSVIGVAVATGLPPTERDSSVSAWQAVTDGFDGARRLLHRPLLRILTLNTFFHYINAGMADAFFPIVLKNAGFSATLIGSTVTVRTVGMTLIRLVIGTLATKFGALPLLFVATGVCAMALGLMPFVTSAGFVLGASLLMGLATGMAPVLTTVVISENSEPRERPVAMALDGTTVNVARVLNGFGIGAVAQTFGIGRSLVFGNIFVLSGLGFVVSLYARRDRSRPVQSAA